MMRVVPAFIVALIIVAGFVSGCIPRHPPHTPQPMPEALNQEVSPSDPPQRGHRITDMPRRASSPGEGFPIFPALS